MPPADSASAGPLVNICAEPAKLIVLTMWCLRVQAAERAEFEYFMRHHFDTLGEREDMGVQAGHDADFDAPMLDEGAKVEQENLTWRDRPEEEAP